MTSPGVEADTDAGEERGGEEPKILPPAAGIRKLLLTGNSLGEAGVRALALALRKDRCLEVLDLTRYAPFGYTLHPIFEGTPYLLLSVYPIHEGTFGFEGDTILVREPLISRNAPYIYLGAMPQF